jgi:hypothetical protein
MAPAQEQALAALVILTICAMAVYRFVVWVRNAPCTVDPWGKEIDEAINRDDAVEVCHHCFTPQRHNGWFCPECGAIVGPYCNYMPYLYIFSEGEVLRAGVYERIRRSPLIGIGYLLFSAGLFAVAAPIYWVFLFMNLSRSRRPNLTIGVDEQQTERAAATQEAEIGTVKKCSWCGREYPEEATVCPIDGYPLVRAKQTR